jgi:hypothetical protein
MTAPPAQPTQPVPTEAATRRGARRSRPLLLIGTFVVTVALLIWGADWVARRVAENQLAGEIENQTGSLTDPAVAIHGAFFLPQVFRGEYDRVDITFRELTDGPLRLQNVQAQLSGVHVPFRDVLVRASNPVLVEHADEQAFLTYEDLNTYLAATAQPVTVQGTDSGLVLLTGSIQLGDATVVGTAEARIAAQGNAVAVTPTRLVSDSPLATISQVLLGERFTFLIPLDPLPFGEQVTEIDPQEGGLLIRAQGDDLVLAP